jgi:hypothetical protein
VWQLKLEMRDRGDKFQFVAFANPQASILVRHALSKA